MASQAEGLIVPHFTNVCLTAISDGNLTHIPYRLSEDWWYEVKSEVCDVIMGYT